MAKFTDESVMPFGKHRGTKLGDVDASYLLWLLNELRDEERIKLFVYLQENEKALQSEVPSDERG